MYDEEDIRVVHLRVIFTIALTGDKIKAFQMFSDITNIEGK